MSAGVIVTWIILSFVVGVIGASRKITFGGAFFLSILLSPLIGLIITLVSEKKDQKKIAAKKMHEKGWKNFMGGDYQEAVNKLKEAINTNENDYEAHLDLARSYNNLGKLDLSLKHLARAVELGYSDYENIEKDKDLEALRQTEKFKAFSDKGYKL